MTKTGSEPAFPSHGTMGEVNYQGMSKRELGAFMCLQGLLANSHVTKVFAENHGNLAKTAISEADALLKALSESENSK